MSMYEIYKQAKHLLTTMPKDMRNSLILTLLKEDAINFIDISNQYVKALEFKTKDQLNQLIEAETCAADHLFHYKKENKYNHDAIHRTLHLMNKSGRFNTKVWNEKFNYDEEKDRKLSFYERTK